MSHLFFLLFVPLLCFVALGMRYVVVDARWREWAPTRVGYTVPR